MPLCFESPPKCIVYYSFWNARSSLARRWTRNVSIESVACLHSRVYHILFSTLTSPHVIRYRGGVILWRLSFHSTVTAMASFSFATRWSISRQECKNTTLELIRCVEARRWKRHWCYYHLSWLRSGASRIHEVSVISKTLLDETKSSSLTAGS